MLTPSPALSQRNPSSQKRLYTTTGAITLTLLVASLALNRLDEDEQHGFLEFLSICSELSDVSTSTSSSLADASLLYIDAQRDALAGDLAIGAGPALDDLLRLLPAHPSLERVMRTHRRFLIRTLYQQPARAWLLTLLNLARYA